MTVTGLPDDVRTELVVHTFLPLDGARAQEAYGALRYVWARCSSQLRLTEPVPGVPAAPPAELEEILGGADQTRIIPVAAVACPAPADEVVVQAVLRVWPPFLGLSVAMSTGGLGADAGDGWRGIEARWDELSAPLAGLEIAEARIYVGVVARTLEEPMEVAQRLVPALPAAAGIAGWRERAARPADGLLVWELPSGEDAGARRQFVAVSSTGEAAELGRWLWSDGTMTPPRFATYLAHAAALRYHVRVWQRDRRVSALLAQADGAISEARALGASHLSALRAAEVDVVLDAGRLRQMEDSARIASQNMARALGSTPEEGPFAHDAVLTNWFLGQLASDARSLERVAELARRVGDISAPALTSTRPDARGSSRDVFVVYGRDTQLRKRMFDFLRSLDLNPMQWNPLVEASGSVAPFLGEVVEYGIRQAQVVVALWTPDDIVRLHESLSHGHDLVHEREAVMQPRPNVLLETGMALALYPGRTIIVHVGALRPVADTDGRFHVRLDATAKCLGRLVRRLRQAGCPVDTSGDDWLDTDRFADLAATSRRPSARLERD